MRGVVGGRVGLEDNTIHDGWSDAINILVGVCAEAGIENDRLRWSWG